MAALAPPQPDVRQMQSYAGADSCYDAQLPAERRTVVTEWRTQWRLEPLFVDATDKLRNIANMKYGWDSYDAAVPSKNALDLAAEAMIFLRKEKLPPTKVLPSSEGGVAICFVLDNRYADIEFLNTGEVLAVTYRGAEEPNVWEIEKSDSGILDAIGRIRRHFIS